MAESVNHESEFIRWRKAPTSDEEIREVTRESEREWQDSRKKLAEMRAHVDPALVPISLQGALDDAKNQREYWAKRLRETFGIDPPETWLLGRPLLASEVTEFLTSSYNFTYWHDVLTRVTQAFDERVVRGDGLEMASLSAWQEVCNVCEDQAVNLDGGLMLLAGTHGIGAALPSTSVVGYVASRTSLRKNKRLAKVLSAEASVRQQETRDVLLDELQSAVWIALGGADEKGSGRLTGTDLVNASATEVYNQLRDIRDSVKVMDESFEDSLATFEAKESVRESERSEAVRRGDEASLLLDTLLDSAELTGRQRQIFDLRREGLKFREIADELGISAGAARATMDRVGAKLKRTVTD